MYIIMCKLEVGVCADIELDADADADKVYLAIAQALRGFFLTRTTLLYPAAAAR